MRENGEILSKYCLSILLETLIETACDGDGRIHAVDPGKRKVSIEFSQAYRDFPDGVEAIAGRLEGKTLYAVRIYAQACMGLQGAAPNDLTNRRHAAFVRH